MSQDINNNSAPNATRNKKAGHKERNKRTGNHGQNIKGSRQAKPTRPTEGQSSQHTEGDFELNIQDEIVNGNFKARGRKTRISINHLLEFQLPERTKEPSSGAVAGKKKTKRSDQEHIHLHGDSYINANFKFLVDDRFTYEEQGLDPNVPIPHEKIVRVTASKGQSCPICLSQEIIAPRMVSCGHLFCQTCLLSFFAAGAQEQDKGAGINYKKKRYMECPLCSTIIRKEKSIPVTFSETDEALKLPQVGQVETFQLMCKPHGSMLPLPVMLDIDPMSLHHFPPVELSELAPYSRIMKCSSQYAVELYKRDILNIEMQYELDRALYNDDGKFVRLAIEENKAMIALSEQASQEKSLPFDISQLSLDVGLEKYNDENAFFFFQTAFDANTRFFLSPLDVKVLLTAFGRYSAFPPSLTAHVENIHFGAVVTEHLMQRYKYFGHLPIGSEMAFVDIDWRSVDILQPEVYQKFAPELLSRRRKSTWKRQREDKEKKRYEKRLEREQEEFYMRENGNLDPEPSIVKPAKLVALPDRSSETESKTSKSPSRLEKTVWGTSIPASERASESQEDAEFEKFLVNLNQQSQPQQGKKKKKKRMVTLISSNPSRGSI